MKQAGDLSKRRIQPAHFTSTSDILKNLKENKPQTTWESKGKVSPVQTQFKEQLVVVNDFDDEMSDDDDPRTGTQLVNNASFAHCS